MDNLRLFSTFPTSNKTFHKQPQAAKKLLPRDENGMINRNQDEKPYVSRQEILEKINKKKAGEMQMVQKPKGQKFAMEWMEENEEAAPAGDIQKNDPRDPMTSEKLKTMLTNGAVNFNNKEQEILKKILG